MREREREREKEREREREAIHVLLIHSIFAVAFILLFFLYFTYEIRILGSLQN